MDLMQKILLGILVLSALAVVLRVLRTPLTLALKLFLNTLFGFLALFLLNLATPLTGFLMGLNVWNALTIGVLGLPGLGLLLLLQWIL